MAGHSKWSNIKHKKARQDAIKGKIFTKVIREIVSAAKQGDPDPDKNPRLRAAVEKALSVNMTRDTINRAVDRGTGGGDNENMEEVSYEGYGVGGVAVLVETMTDNLNRTVSEVRHAFTKFDGNLGTSGSVAYLFTKRGEIRFDDVSLEDDVLLAALDAGALDVENDGESLLVTTEWESFGQVKDALNQAGLVSDSAEVTMAPATSAEIDNVDDAEKVMKMLDMLEDIDDVQEVYSNVHISDEVMAQLESE
ncbi:YebC/PmpR family DNA-binding transcriptional regulator [Psychrobacter submarinus]|jgi:YebC/PmpR family DNA-binding regulatory protein|uniref:YebC/PmpR family DNA-binding transcriptional regulator n=1 Tax=Psychrobacter submarinus TaxID=154108 RepID=UPI000C3E583D|nr:YebC/PmpR family DNA-binding transcriptional regulator [Psychrobacter submarinus]MAE40339.1 YebC/PmpR family DNA-binding transcriptional regulator [Psychrobacter sp.]HAM61139.1 YebC/PmpR family DNA-binding transcriptional regulator [Psychrobacter sp.]|tara:strand:- start:165 stop:917 length:753 start_codon:yes stop_codon:yes gene_type:complete